jgi:hypothetical protein
LCAGQVATFTTPVFEGTALTQNLSHTILELGFGHLHVSAASDALHLREVIYFIDRQMCGLVTLLRDAQFKLNAFRRPAMAVIRGPRPTAIRRSVYTLLTIVFRRRLARNGAADAACDDVDERG